jgi:D-alanyl-D-alanine carboxypeptidase/D-alanyl-D-alanine-endopeptidase (penicillin-binding protein 4)
MKKSMLLVLMAFAVANAWSQTTPTALDKLKAEVTRIAAEPGVANGDLGFILMDVESGKVLAENSADKTLLPASTLKVVTSMASLGILGENYTFKTKLEYDGTLDEQGVLHGNLYIRGGGDPTLGSDRWTWGTDRVSVMKTWAQVIAEKGIKKIDGAVVGDESIFGDEMLSSTWVWGDIGNYYGAGACGLTFNENTYYLYFKPGATAGTEAALLRHEPEIPGIQLVNEMKTGSPGSGDNGYVYGAPYTYLRYLRGTVPAGPAEFSIKGSIPDPSLYCAQMLTLALTQGGVTVSKPAETVRIQQMEGRLSTATRTLVHTHTSPPLKDVVFWVNKKSVNLFAEHLLRICGVQNLKDGSTEGGANAVEAYWASKGVNIKGLHMMDGSGLSRYNGITPRQHASMLRIATKEPWFNSFWNSLPIAGDPNDVGSISSMCTGTAAAKNLRAKSGYISRVRTYTGYCKSKSGKLMCFSMLANNYTCTNSEMKDKLEKLMVMIAEVE